jgi:hypothetical protein
VAGWSDADIIESYDLTPIQLEAVRVFLRSPARNRREAGVMGIREHIAAHT